MLTFIETILSRGHPLADSAPFYVALSALTPGDATYPFYHLYCDACHNIPLLHP